MSAARRSIAILAIATLAGCAAAPERRDVPRRVEPPVRTGPITTAPTRPPASTPGTPGGYYLDDGPHEKPPPNLDQIPEPEPKPEPLHRFANEPYTVFGQTFVPERVVRSSVARGVASWYGRRFHGNKTAIGEIYDMYALTAAHPTLPLPSYARVTNVANGRSVVVRVNDRGPFVRGRSIDLSYAAAARLGFIQQGSAQVEIEALDPRQMASRAQAQTNVAASSAPVATLISANPRTELPSGPGTPPHNVAPVATAQAAAGLGFPLVEEGGRLFVQVGAFKSADNADNVLARFLFQLEGFERGMRVVQRQGLHRIWAGPFADRSEALAAVQRLAAAR